MKKRRRGAAAQSNNNSSSSSKSCSSRWVAVDVVDTNLAFIFFSLFTPHLGQFKT
ncbi:hypothetical protein PP707_06745 [Acetobacter pasteurianus]|nr:hypothetical protein [Acetobacter pasteurianus]